MAVTVEGFRAAFPAFGSAQTYPNAEVQWWLDLAVKLHDATRWGDLLDFGVYLFVAHNLSLEFNAKASSKNGQNPGQVVGAVTSGSVDKVSYSRDAGSAMDPKNGHWNLSIYGLRHVRMVSMIGAGPVQVGAVLTEGVQPWFGPNLYP